MVTDGNTRWPLNIPKDPIFDISQRLSYFRNGWRYVTWNVVGGLIVACRTRPMTNHPWTGCGQGHVTPGNLAEKCQYVEKRYNTAIYLQRKTSSKSCMACKMVPTAVTLNGADGWPWFIIRTPVVQLLQGFTCNSSTICAAYYTVPTDSVPVRCPRDCWASCSYGHMYACGL